MANPPQEQQQQHSQMPAGLMMIVLPQVPVKADKGNLIYLLEKKPSLLVGHRTPAPKRRLAASVGRSA